MNETRIAVVGATGAVGTVALRLLAERGYRDVRALASARSSGRRVPFGDGALVVEEATAETLAAGGIDVALFSVGTSASRELVPHAVRGGAVAIDKSSAYRLVDGVPLVVPEVNGPRALEHDGVVANPNCSTIQLVCVLKPLHDRAGLRRVRVATYQSVSGAGASRMDELRAQGPDDHDLRADWTFDGIEFDEETKMRAEARKILELPELPFSATCVRVPVLVGHGEAVWVETDEPLSPEQASDALRSAPGVRVVDGFPSPGTAAGGDDVLVGRIRRDAALENGLALYVSGDNLRKGAALNAIQIAELIVEHSLRGGPSPPRRKSHPRMTRTSTVTDRMTRPRPGGTAAGSF